MSLGGSHHQRGPTLGRVGTVDVRAVFNEQLDGLRERTGGRVNQGRSAGTVAPAHLGAVVEQDLDHLDVALERGHHQGCATVGVGLVDVQSLLERPPDSLHPSRSSRVRHRRPGSRRLRAIRRRCARLLSRAVLRGRAAPDQHGEGKAEQEAITGPA